MKQIKSQSLLLSERYTQIDIFENRIEISRVLGSDMADESSYDVLHGVGNEHEILQLSDAAYAEEWQFQEPLQMSMIPSQMKRDDRLSPSSLVTPAAVVKVGKWKGLKEEEDDHQIVWPPMVVIRNTSIPTDNKWKGMRSLELLQQFSSYDAIKARHFYGPQGHLGISLLIFEKSAAGYTEAERLHKSFSMQGIGRDAWNSCPAAATIQGGARQLYGYLAAKDDLDFLNKYCQGKLKYEMKSYREVIVNQIKKLSEDSQQLIWVKLRLRVKEMHVKNLEESVCAQRKKLHLKREEMSKLRQRIQQQHEEHKEEIKFLENFYMYQIRGLEAKVTEEAPATLNQADSDIFQMEEYEET
ncbi:hypothetical protein SLA2020_199830 [Shorea laevis]